MLNVDKVQSFWKLFQGPPHLLYVVDGNTQLKRVNIVLSNRQYKAKMELIFNWIIENARYWLFFILIGRILWFFWENVQISINRNNDIFPQSDKKGENMKDWTGTQSFVCRVNYKVNYRSQPNKIPYMITLEGLLTCLFQEMVIKGEIMKDQIRTKSWFIWVSFVRSSTRWTIIIN